MPDPLRYLLFGAGGVGAIWARNALPRLMEMQKAIPAAVVDSSDERLQFAQDYLHVTPQNCFTDAMEAMENRRADFAIIAAPTPQREKLIDAALDHDMHILCEAPIADTIQSTLKIYRRSKNSKKKFEVSRRLQLRLDMQSMD